MIKKFSGRDKVPIGEESSLAFETLGAKKLFVLDNATRQKQEIDLKSKRFQFTPYNNFSYTLIAQNGRKKAEKEFLGKIIKNPPVIYQFTGQAHYTVGDRNPAFLKWSVGKAKKIILRNIAEDLQAEQKINLRLDSTQKFELIAIGEYGDTSRAFHTISVKKLPHSIYLVSSFDSPEMIAGVPNKLAWDFPGADWVMVKDKTDTLKAKDYAIFIPSKNQTDFDTTLFVKYPSADEAKFFSYKAGVVPVKYKFSSSKLRANLYEKIQLRWNCEGAKNVKVRIGDDTLNGQKPKDVYSFVIKKNTEVSLIVTDQYNEDHTRNWNIRCENRRPFIKNAIDYNDFKKNDNSFIKKRLITDIYQVDRSNFPEEVKIRVLITDTLGNFIRGLAPPSRSEKEAKSFFLEIIESVKGKDVNIKNFKVNEINQIISTPYDIGLCLDYSGSMTGSIAQLEKSTQKLINAKEDEDRLALVRFDNKLVTESGLCKNSNELIEKVNWQGLKGFGGYTALYAGIDEALNAFENDKENSDRQKILFVFTDGHENASFQHSEKGRLFRATDVAKKARKLGVRIYPIAFGEAINEELLYTLGWITDGKLIMLDNTAHIEEAYVEIPHIFRNYYEISYKPVQITNTDEGKRQISLKYFNRQSIVYTSTNYQNNNNFELEGNEVYVKGNAQGKKILTPPQAVAFFDFDRANLKAKYTPNIEVIARFLKNNPSTKAEILGHTDQVGTTEKNLDLSKKRAEVVQNYLVSQGIDISRLTVKALGESQPIWKQEEYDWQAQENRRIEVIIWE